jgi:hypothetical protein
MTVPDIKLMSFDSISPTGIPGVDGEYEADDPSRGMKKIPEEDELRPYYEFDYTKMKPNRFAGEKKIYKECSIPTKTTQKPRVVSQKPESAD